VEGLGVTSDQGPSGNGLADNQYWPGKRVFVTGHTGFKGSWLVAWLQHLGANVKGYALPPDTDPNLYSALNISSLCQSTFGDIRDKSKLLSEMSEFSPEIVFHLAAQPLVRRSYERPLETFETNVMGTINLLESCRQQPELHTILVITTDKVYQNNEQLRPYREGDALGGHDPCSASKAATELAVQSWKKSFFDPENEIQVATARAGNIIGGGDWSVDRLIPDCIRAIQTGSRLTIRSPRAVRPWQHVADAISGYLLLAENMADKPALPHAFNFGPQDSNLISVADVVELVKKNSRQKLDCVFADDPDALHEAGLLALDSSLARNLLGWESGYNTAEAIKGTLEWYDLYDRSPSVDLLLQLMIDQMAACTNL
jgi:CDP-glucose 4,6-dehydratase